MVWFEVTTDVQQAVDKDYACVKMHLFRTDRYVWVEEKQTPKGTSFCNALLTDKEILDLIDKRWQVVEIEQKRGKPAALDFLYEFSQLALKHAWDFNPRRR